MSVAKFTIFFEKKMKYHNIYGRLVQNREAGNTQNSQQVIGFCPLDLQSDYLGEKILFGL